MKKKTSVRKSRATRTRPAPRTSAEALHATRKESLRAVAGSPSAPFKMKPDEIESALITGHNADLLKRYFGEQEYAELQSLARDANARSIRGGPRVLILPGIMGSTLGSPRPLFFDDVIWVDPVDIAAGQLTTLSLIPGPVRHQALGVILFSYLKIKLALKLGGYDADFHPFDWRQSIDGLGQELADRLANDEAAPEISLVAHSMGGLVARAALKAGAKKVKRLVMLGTPNFGSFVPVQAFRAIYPIVRKIALLDLAHSPEELAEKVFSTFPGLYQMLPASEKFSTFDVFDLKFWPTTGPVPRQALLDVGRKAQNLLAAPDDRFILIAGINQDTVIDAQFDGSRFHFSVSKEGDGTVPLAFAQLPNVPTYYVEESHGSLPNNGKVISAVKDLLAEGMTQVLPQQWSLPQRAAPRLIDEETVRGAVPDADTAAQGAAVSDQAVRELLSEVVAPPPAAGQAVVATGAAASMQDVVVGRRLQRRLDVRLAQGSIAEANSKAYVLGIFRDVTPTGAAQAIDAKMDGAIAEFSRRRMFGGEVGEVFVIPTGSHPIRPEHIILAGLGTFDRFTQDVLELVSENVVRTLVLSGVDDFATVVMGGSSGKEIGPSLEHMMTGFVRGLLDADTEKTFRRVTLCETDPERFNEMRDQLYQFARTKAFDKVEISFDETELPAPAAPVTPARGLVSISESPTYLNVHGEKADHSLEFLASVLTSGSKAAVMTGRKLVPDADLNSLLAEVDRADFQKVISRFGASVGELVMIRDILSVLATMRDKPLVVVHDPATSRIPWETLRIGDWVPALSGGLSRRYSAENLSVAKLLEQRQKTPVLKILLVVNPTGDLDGAVEEGKRIGDLFSARPGFSVVRRFQGEATRQTLLKDFMSGEFDVLHYAGHAFFDPNSPSRSGILCAGKQVLSGGDLLSLARLPNLVFFNACESGRTRGGKVIPDKSARKRIDENIGLAEAYLRGGVANFIGTYWPVGDDAASAFAEEFYMNVINGIPVGRAVLMGRQKVQALGSKDWADYVHYGSAEFVLKEKP